jgi:hypothetical protein
MYLIETFSGGQLMEAHSGHYLPTPENFRALIETLTSNGADLTVAKVCGVQFQKVSTNEIL